MKDWYREAAFEHAFWLQVLGDHARFILHSLSPSETQAAQTARDFLARFDGLLVRARGNPTADGMRVLTEEAVEATSSLRKFKLELLSRLLNNEVRTGLPPTFYNHMINELDEYARLLACLRRGEAPPRSHALHHHLLWLLDGAGHAWTIEDELDPVEKRLKMKSAAFMAQFEHFYLKAVEMAGYLRTGKLEFPALTRFNTEVELAMTLFKQFLRELEQMELTAQTLSTFSALMADHMAREECYYLTKLAEVSNVRPPACDPAKPRTRES